MYFTHFHLIKIKNKDNTFLNFKKWSLLLHGIPKAVNSLYNTLTNLTM